MSCIGSWNLLWYVRLYRMMHCACMFNHLIVNRSAISFKAVVSLGIHLTFLYLYTVL